MRAVFVDVGGTHIRIWVEDTFGRLHNKFSCPTDLARLPKIIHRYLKTRCSHPHQIIIGMRGVWTSQEKSTWRTKLKRLAKHVDVLSDIELAHRLAFKNGPGIVLNAGTGSIAYGRGPNGKTARAGGLGPLLGDEGSAFWIGREYLRRFSTERGKRLDVRRVASFAKRALHSAYNRHDAKALAIVNEAQKYLVQLALEVKNKLQWKGKTPLVMVGGLFKNKRFRRQFTRKVSRRV